MKITALANEPGKLTLALKHGEAVGLMIVDIYEDDGGLCFGITKLLAEIDLPPREWLRLVRRGIGEIEEWARKAGCTEIRVAGRDWSRVLPDFMPLAGPRNGLRKVL